MKNEHVLRSSYAMTSEGRASSYYEYPNQYQYQGGGGGAGAGPGPGPGVAKGREGGPLASLSRLFARLMVHAVV